MRKILLCLTVALAIAGCAADQQDAQAPSSKAARAQTGAPGMATSILSSTTAKRAVFASLPDHGALLAYAPGQQPIRRGAQTYHAVQLSEAHALNAAAPGKSIELPTPSGGTMHIDYLRHEEGLDGNWSWVGKTADGLDAVITFGESAVFGRIAQRDTEALRVTMSAGRTWLVESDPGKMLDGNLGRASDEPDVLIPPSVAAAVSAKKRSTAAMTAASDEAASAANTIDVVLGYTNGLVTKYGSVANANTRLSNLVAITNQGYVNSLVTPRIRLVRTVQVSYTDTNSNETALEAVTGYTCTTTGCTTQAVPTELVPLRTARDTYGGDLVSLIRPFQAPQHQGCGIAWLLGGGGFTIDNTDAPFGYSVASDGTDVDETDGRTYFCREETLAHELGHNMGQQHNIEDAGTPPDTGTHSYSYGYREATTTGFYTVMAYRLANSSQFSINYFGNPSVNYADTGRPTGSAAADNARSLNLSMPLVVQFRNSVVPFGGKVPNDINGDGRSDIALRNFGVERFTYFNMNGAAYTTGSYDYMVNTYAVATSGDYNGDGRADFVWRNDTARVLYMWFSTAGGFVQQFVSGFPAGWQIVGSGDVNQDGKDDILWRNSATEQFSYWVMNGAQVTSSAASYMVNTYSVAATGDFNGDGRTDVVWLRPGFNIYMGLANAAGGYDLQFVANHTNGWAIAGAVDIDADGKDDLVMRNFANEQLRYMIMNGAQTVRQQDTYFVNTYNVAGLGDYDGDGYGDIMWVRPGFNVYLWRGNGTSFALEYVTNLASVWSIVPASNL
jgi:peptidyl-Asp metalloendopeptidase